MSKRGSAIFIATSPDYPGCSPSQVEAIAKANADNWFKPSIARQQHRRSEQVSDRLGLWSVVDVANIELGKPRSDAALRLDSADLGRLCAELQTA